MNKEILLSLILLLLLFLLFDPLQLLMLTSIQMLLLCFLAVASLLYGIFLFRAVPADEREQLHLFVASRLGFFIGALILTVAIVVEKIAHRSITWLLLALAGMVLGKIIGIVWSRYTK